LNSHHWNKTRHLSLYFSMKITFVLPGVGGGGPRVIAEYAKGLLERGHDVRILYPVKSGVREILRGVYLRMCYGGGYNNKAGYTMLGKFPGEAVPYRILTPELVGRNDTVIAVDSDCVRAVAHLPDSCGMKIGHFHGRALPELGDQEERMREAWRLPMPKIVVASHIERAMRQQSVTDPIYIVHNGVDRSEYFTSVSDEVRSGVGTVYAGDYTKGPEVALAVFQRIYRLRPQTRLAMFGGYPRPAGLPKGTRYVRLPSIAMARDIYSRAVVWFCASRREGFPGVVLEAMACGCAVVSTDCGGPADQIDDGLSGFLTPVDDAEQMVERIFRLLDNPGLRQRFVAASRTKLAQFTWPNAVQRFEAVLTDVVCKASTERAFVDVS
jgi:glycosyltransferase involved in cell wall biosynthesis